MDSGPNVDHFFGVTPLQKRLLARVNELAEKTTICPGQLARQCGATLLAARPDLLALVREGKMILTQKGQPFDPATMKGPFRVGKA